MSKTLNNDGSLKWAAYQVWLLRFFTVFFAVLSIPIDPRFYAKLFSSGLYITDLLGILTYLPDFFSEYEQHPWGILSFSSWILAAVAGIAGAVIWGIADKKQRTARYYDNHYYWLRVLLRYRLGFILIVYGLIKVFPLQMPFPSISNLHTNYGDFLPWKIYFHTVGVAPYYETFLGVVEALAGILLFFRNGVTFGTGIIIGFIGNVLFANISYALGSHVLAVYIVLVSLFLFAHDLPRLYRLLAQEKPAEAEKFQPDLSGTPVRETRKILKVFSLIAVLVLIVSAYTGYTKDPYLIPHTKGLKGVAGFYNVKEFVLNGDTLPYTRTDPRRWQNLVFEEWATISIKDARPILVDSSVHHAIRTGDLQRVYESSGVGDRRYFQYTIDSLSGNIRLTNKNPHHASERFTLSYRIQPDSSIVLSGTNEHSDSIYAVLEKINRKYMLIEGRRKPVKL